MSEPTDELVEAVARAICDHTREMTRYDDYDDYNRKFWRDHARAALSAAEPAIRAKRDVEIMGWLREQRHDVGATGEEMANGLLYAIERGEVVDHNK